jgi:hypothetical protein
MTWSYNTSLSATRDQVRFYAGDTDSAAAITLSDEEILGVIAMAGGARSAAALVCEHLAQRYATVGQTLRDDIGQEVDYGTRAQFYADRAKTLRAMVGLTAIPFAGGISTAQKETQEADSDRVEPAFTVDVHQNPGVNTDRTRLT